MREPPAAEGAMPPPRNPARHAWFEGILEGKRDPGRDAALRAIVAEIRALGLAPDLELDGGRFSVLFDEGTIAGAAIDNQKREALAMLVQRLAEASADPRSVESTLRCTAIHAESAVETLFAVAAGESRGMSRVRRLRPGDSERAPVETSAPDALRQFGRRRAAWIGVLVLVAFGMLTWESGWLDRLFGASPDTLGVHPGPFGSMLAVEVAESWGNYQVTVRRGPSYPGDVADLPILQSASETTAERAAVNAVANGITAYVQLIDEDDQPIAFARIELAPLLTDTDRETTAVLPGKIRARAVRLALDAGAGTR